MPESRVGSCREVGSTVPAAGVVATLRWWIAVSAVVAALGLAGCPGGGQMKSLTFDPKADLFADNPDAGAPGALQRTFQCTSKNADGSCNVNECKQGPGGATFDCASFAAACVDAGHHWSGTKEGGKCTRVL